MTAGTACLNRWGHTTELATGTRRATYRAAGMMPDVSVRVLHRLSLLGALLGGRDRSPKRGDGGGGGEDDDDEGGGRRSGRERLASQRARDL
ncbi:unnamed protein product [Lampetra planeri]